MITSWLFCN